jgi:hypothetical protein
MLSSEWLIVTMGKPIWKPGWEAIRPETYNRKPPEDNLREELTNFFNVLNGGIQRFIGTSSLLCINHLFTDSSRKSRADFL